jgi:hypothetical protein
MRTVHNCLIGLGVFSSFHAAVAASPIQVQVVGTVDGAQVNQTVELSDTSQPLVIPDVADRLLSANSVANGDNGGNNNSSFHLLISVQAPNSSEPASVAVAVSGDIHDSFFVTTPGGSVVSGTASGSGSGADLESLSGTRIAAVPPYLADLLNHPERVSYFGVVSGPLQDELLTTLTIGPPVDPNAVVPAPEPSTLAVALMALASLPIVRLRRSPNRAGNASSR